MKSKHDYEDINLYIDHILDLSDGLDKIIQYTQSLLEENDYKRINERFTNSMMEKDLDYDISPYLFESESRLISSTARKIHSEMETFVTGTSNIMRKYDNL